MAIIPMVPVPPHVRVYDSGPDFHDRFTVVFPDDSIYTMSTNAMSPIGMCQYAGTVQNVPFDPDAIRVEMIPDHVAQRIALLDV